MRLEAKYQKLLRQHRALAITKIDEFEAKKDRALYDQWVEETNAKIAKINASIRATNKPYKSLTQLAMERIGC